jgi:hypothetical protein
MRIVTAPNYRDSDSFAAVASGGWPGSILRGRGPSTYDVRPAFRKEEKTTFECQSS